MQAQEGLFLSGALPDSPSEPAGLEGIALGRPAPPGEERLASLFAPDARTAGTPAALPFCAIIVPPLVKRKALVHLRGTFAKDYKTLFPDVSGFAEALRSGHVPLPPEL